jgi:hypothetical protein
LKNASVQIGAKYFLSKTLMLQAEVNSIGKVKAATLYSHYNAALNHPFPSYSTEYVGVFQFNKNRWLSRLAGNIIENSNSTIQFIDARQSFIINPSYNFTVHLGAQLRNEEFAVLNVTAPTFPLRTDNNTLFVYFGLSTNLQNIYFNY